MYFNCVCITALYADLEYTYLQALKSVSYFAVICILIAAVPDILFGLNTKLNNEYKYCGKNYNELDNVQADWKSVQCCVFQT